MYLLCQRMPILTTRWRAEIINMANRPYFPAFVLYILQVNATLFPLKWYCSNISKEICYVRKDVCSTLLCQDVLFFCPVVLIFSVGKPFIWSVTHICSNWTVLSTAMYNYLYLTCQINVVELDVHNLPLRRKVKHNMERAQIRCWHFGNCTWANVLTAGECISITISTQNNTWIFILKHYKNTFCFVLRMCASKTYL